MPATGKPALERTGGGESSLLGFSPATQFQHESFSLHHPKSSLPAIEIPSFRGIFTSHRLLSVKLAINLRYHLYHRCRSSLRARDPENGYEKLAGSPNHSVEIRRTPRKRWTSTRGREASSEVLQTLQPFRSWCSPRRDSVSPELA